jgi:hypothetical protein
MKRDVRFGPLVMRLRASDNTGTAARPFLISALKPKRREVRSGVNNA